MRRADLVPRSPERIEAIRKLCADKGLSVEETDDLLNDDPEMWKNHRYTVMVDRDDSGIVKSLSIRRNDRKALRDWRDLQRIKNEIAGEDVEAMELYPMEERVVDTSNQFWLWCLPPGTRIPVGFEHGIKDYDEETARKVGARQRRDES
jgi:hypothetical protein